MEYYNLSCYCCHCIEAAIISDCMKMCRELLACVGAGLAEPELCLSLIFSVKYFTFKTFQLLLFHCSGSASVSGISSRVSASTMQCTTVVLLQAGWLTNWGFCY